MRALLGGATFAVVLVVALAVAVVATRGGFLLGPALAVVWAGMHTGTAVVAGVTR